MRKIAYIFAFLLLFIAGASSAQINTWQAQQGYITSIQNQLNNIQSQINSFLLPPGATAGQIVVENAAGTAFVAVTVSGDISASITVPGQLTVTSLSAVNGPVSITGSTSTSSIQQVNGAPQGLFNVGAYGWSKSVTNTTIAVTGGLTAATITSPTGFLKNDTVVIKHGGASATIGAPTGLTLSLLTDGTAVSGESLGTGDASTACFSKVLAHNHVKIGSIQVVDTTDSITAKYDTMFTPGTSNPAALGIIPADTNIESGYIEYTTGRVGICYTAGHIPSNLAAITVNYSYDTSIANLPEPVNAGCTKDVTTDNGTEAGNNCATSWAVQVVAQAADGSSSAPSTKVTVQNGPAHLSYANRLRVNIDGNANAVGYRIYACSDTANGSPANCTPTLVASNDNIWYTNTTFAACGGCAAPTNYDWDYLGMPSSGASSNGGAAPIDLVDGTTLPSGAEAADFTTTISAINGTAVTLAAAPTQTGTLTIAHDNGPVIKAAITAAVAANTGGSAQGGEVWLPCGDYQIGSTITESNQRAIRIHGCGPGGSSLASTVLHWVGGSGMPVFDYSYVRDPYFENLGMVAQSSNESDPGVWFSFDKKTGACPGCQVPSHGRMYHVAINGGGDPIVIANEGNQNNESYIFNDVYINAGSPIPHHQFGLYVAGSAQTNLITWSGGSIGGCDVGMYGNFAGELQVDNAGMSVNQVNFAAFPSGNITKQITINKVYDETTSIAFDFPFANSSAPYNINDSSFLAGSLTAPGTAEPTVPAIGVIGINGVHTLNISKTHFGSPFAPLEQIWTRYPVGSVNNAFVNTVPPYVISTNTVAIPSMNDEVDPQNNLEGTYGPLRILSNGNNTTTDSIITPLISGFSVAPMANPGAPVLTQIGGGASTCNYQIVFVDSNGNKSLPSASASVSCPAIGAFSTNNGNYVKIATPNGLPAALDHVDILTSATRTADTTKTIGSFPCTGSSVFGCFGYDFGQAVTTYTAPTRNTSGDISIPTPGIISADAVNQCTWSLTISGTSPTSTPVPCLANHTKVGYTIGAGGVATSFATPAAVTLPIPCAQPSPNATSIACGPFPTTEPTVTIYGWGE